MPRNEPGPHWPPSPCHWMSFPLEFREVGQGKSWRGLDCCRLLFAQKAPLCPLDSSMWVGQVGLMAEFRPGG